jgi:LPXTG-motif cell wall-anchored protein
MRQLLRLLVPLAVVSVLVLHASPADAIDLPPLSTGLRVIIGPEGTIAPLGIIDAETRFPQLVGQQCSATIDVLNNESEHPGTDVLITNGTQVIVIEDVERMADEDIQRPIAALVLARQLDAAVRLGPDGVFSGGLTVQVTCPDTPVTTTTQPPTTTTTVAPTTTPPTTAAVIPPPPPAPKPPAPQPPPAARTVTPSRVVTAPSQLPRTGSSTGPLVVLGAGAVALGLVALRYGRRLRRI